MKHILYSPPAIILITLLVIISIIKLRGNLGKVDISEQNYYNMQQDVSERKTQLQPLRQQLEAVQEPLGKEKIARNELLKKKEGEYVLYIPDVEVKNQEAGPTPTPEPIEEWKQLLRI